MSALKYANDAYTIGYFREDGDIRVLATLSNRDGELRAGRWSNLVEETYNRMVGLYADIGFGLSIFAREDAPDYVEEAVEAENVES